MSNLFTKFSGWFLVLMLATIILEILAVGVFAAGWCLHSVFGHYAILVVVGAALLITAIHHGYEAMVHHHRDSSWHSLGNSNMP